MEADFVVVGAGSAGCLLADRLSADGARRVVVLEAGPGDRHPGVRIPALFSHLFRTRRDWALQSTPEPALGGRSLYLPRGRTLGGSSSINAMVYVRGVPADYDGWAEQAGPEWSWKELLPCFRRIEDNVHGADAFHGAGGSLRVEDLRSPHRLSHAFVEAAVAAGHRRCRDFNGAHQDGAGLFQVTQRRGLRCSAADAFLHPARRRRNLHLRTGARVTSIDFDGARATGIRFTARGRTERIACEGEIILCAGTFESPRLLLLSGIGPPTGLDVFGIRVRHAAQEVGRNLQDHPALGIHFLTTTRRTYSQADRFPQLLGHGAQWLLARRGAGTSNVAEAGLFARSTVAGTACDLQFHFAPAMYEEHGFKRPSGHGVSYGAAFLEPRSRGRVTLSTRDPLAPPCIQTNALAEAHDLEAVLDSLEQARHIATHSPLREHLDRELVPGPDCRSRADREAYARSAVELLYHPVGTCRMGGDAESVVDPHLRVRGVENLRVIDASVMPRIVHGNTQAATLAIAERAAPWVLAGE